MSIRETLSKHPAIAIGLTAVVLVAAVLYAVKSLPQSNRSRGLTQYFFSADDGKTWFPDDVAKVPPFKTSDGKDAVRAFVYSCDGGKTSSVFYLQRATADAKAKMEKIIAETPGLPGVQKAAMAVPGGVEVKKPGEKEWHPFGSPGFFATVKVSCPGTGAAPDQVNPVD